MKVCIAGFDITAQEHQIDWHNDGITLFEVARCECDEEENVVNWIPTYLIESLSTNPQAAKQAIADYLAGWRSALTG